MRSLVMAACVLSLSACSGPGTPPPADTLATGAPTVALRAIGTEPFWALFIDSAGVRFTTPEDTAGRRLTTAGPARIGDTLRWTGVTERDSFDIRIWGATCSDGMSDLVYPNAASVWIGGRSLTGCARPAP
jgi:uncharacterized membrane protein